MKSQMQYLFARALTTVRNPVAEVMAAAVELAVGEASGAAAADVPRRVFMPKLVVRGSTGPPPADAGRPQRDGCSRPRSAIAASAIVDGMGMRAPATGSPRKRSGRDP